MYLGSDHRNEIIYELVYAVKSSASVISLRAFGSAGFNLIDHSERKRQKAATKTMEKDKMKKKTTKDEL